VNFKNVIVAGQLGTCMLQCSIAGDANDPRTCGWAILKYFEIEQERETLN